MTVTGQALLTSMMQSLKINPARYTRGGKREGEGQQETRFFQNKHRNVTTNPVSLVACRPRAATRYCLAVCLLSLVPCLWVVAMGEWQLIVDLIGLLALAKQ